MVNAKELKKPRLIIISGFLTSDDQQKQHCRNLALDACHALAEMDDIDFRASLAGFIVDLGKTRIQKLARILTCYPAKEEKGDYLQHGRSYPS